MPSTEAQAELLRNTYAQAGLDPASVDFVEAHATGTRVGDPAESAAIDAVIASAPNRVGPLLVGSIKSNAGHAELASGLMSVAKVIIALERACIPANLHYVTPNPYISGLTVNSSKC